MRVIGICHRVKRTAEGEARPTQVAILKNGKTINLELEMKSVARATTSPSDLPGEASDEAEEAA